MQQTQNSCVILFEAMDQCCSEPASPVLNVFRKRSTRDAAGTDMVEGKSNPGEGADLEPDVQMYGDGDYSNKQKGGLMTCLTVTAVHPCI